MCLGKMIEKQGGGWGVGGGGGADTELESNRHTDRERDTQREFRLLNSECTQAIAHISMKSDTHKEKCQINNKRRPNLQSQIRRPNSQSQNT